MNKCLNKLIVLSLLWVSHSVMANLCLDNICIGDDIELLNVDWNSIELTYADEKFVERQLSDGTVEDVYYDYNEHLVADKQLLKQILPYVIRTQRFDQSVLDALSRVRAICSSLTLTGEVNNQEEDRLFVTFRAVANEGRRGQLRVVRIEKQYDIMSPHLRAADRPRYKAKQKELKQRFPQLKTVVDIDGRSTSSAMQAADVLLGFRFIGDSFNPLVLKLIDVADIPMIEDDAKAHHLCTKG